MKSITILLLIAITMASSVTLIIKNVSNEDENNPFVDSPSKELSTNENKLTMPSKRVSRFLAEKGKNPRAADHCKKDEDVCLLEGGYNSTCCNNKCIDLWADNKNCGACKNKCEFTETCCNGQCVYLAYDKRHCGSCNNKCTEGLLCVYGMCDYP